MKKRYRSIVFAQVLWIVISLTSCVSSKKIVYFQEEVGKSVASIPQKYEPLLEADDLLTITVGAINSEAAVPFNLYEGAQSTPVQYLVNSNGEIDFPVLGTLKVAGFTTKELSEQLKIRLKDYLKNPTVNIRLVNFKVTILGDVKAPGAYTIASERITIIEALGLAGDLQIQGNRKSVTLIREKGGERTFVPIDLTSKKLFDSPYYFLAQNDVIYVEPNKVKINSSVVGANTSIILSSISILVTLITLFTR